MTQAPSRRGLLAAPAVASAVAAPTLALASSTAEIDALWTELLAANRSYTDMSRAFVAAGTSPSDEDASHTAIVSRRQRR